MGCVRRKRAFVPDPSNGFLFNRCDGWTKAACFCSSFPLFFSEFSFVSFYACTEMLRESRMVYSVLEYDVCSCVLLTSVVLVRSRGDDGEKGRRQDRARRRAGRQQGGQS